MKIMKRMGQKVFLLSAVSFLGMSAHAADNFVTFQRNEGVCLIDQNTPLIIGYDSLDYKGVKIALNSLRGDFKAVTSQTPSTKVSLKNTDTSSRLVIGTIGHSTTIDQLVKKGAINRNDLKGKREKFIITTVGDQIVIAGSDKRGTIYGIYELSRQMGVSPWYYWADAPINKHFSIYIKGGNYTDGEPAVRYRGIFLNDEAPCLTSWVKNTFGTDYGDHRFYAKCYELILRLKGNFMWPAMWGWAFYADDPENSKTADEMGVIMGTSHHEPMARNHQEYARKRKEWGAWNYNTNQKNLDKFFREGIERMKNTEDVVTIGMRGDGDAEMSAETDTKLMERIIANQRKIITEVTHKKASETPQVWALYKEVLDYYDKGMKVPEDATLLLCDDNWGNVRRVPNAQERKHKGGWGLYYHVDYVGAPRNSKWLNVTPIQNMWEQLTLAYQNGIDRMWILNVGDLKPMEYPIQLFMDMAWNPTKYDQTLASTHTVEFCNSIFGEKQGAEAARLLNLVSKYNGRCTAEMMDRNTYNLESGEWKQVVDQYLQLETEALRQYLTLPVEARDAYQQLILFPIQAMGNLHEMYYAQAMNLRLAAQHNAEANEWADKGEECFERDSLLCADYNHKIAGGKWNGMMTQKHIGYRNWNDDFPHDMMPKIQRVEASDAKSSYSFQAKDGYVSIEAEHFYNKDNADKAEWTVIPYMGRTLSGVTLMPYTADVKNASLTYRFKDEGKTPSTVKVHIILKSTLDYLNKGGLSFNLSMDGSDFVQKVFNDKLNEKPENIYSIYYPTVARRVIDAEVELPFAATEDGYHLLTFVPNDPAIVIEKVVIDLGGYQKSYLFGKESSSIDR